MRTTPTVLSNAKVALALAWRVARGPLVTQVVLAGVSGGVPVVAAWAGKDLFDSITSGAGPARIVPLALLVAVTGVLMAFASAPANFLSAIVGARITLAVEDRLFTAVSAPAGLATLEDPGYLDRLRLAEESAGEAPQAMVSFLLGVVRCVVTSAGMLVAMVTIWPPMSVLVALGAVANVLAHRRVARVRVETARIMGEAFRHRYLYRSLLSDARSAKEVRLFGLADFFRDRMISAIRRSTDAQITAERRVFRAEMALSLLAGAIAAVGLLVVAVRAAGGGLGIGDVTLFLAAASGVQYSIQGVAVEWGQARASAELFGAFRALIEPADTVPDGTGEPPPLRHGLELRDVWFRYGQDSPWVLRGVTVFVPAGSSLALVGLNGAGKSSTVKLLCRLYEPERGAIFWDGVDIREYAAAGLRRRMSATFQDFMPYDLIAAENIGIGDLERLTDQPAIRRAARRAGADAMLARLPRGYQTMLSRSFDDAEAAAGVTLSGGQWQRVALARSLMRADADLLLLDEPSSGLDADAEAEVHAVLREHRTGKTSILISHRLATVRDADQIVVLGDGEVVEAGTHADLVSAGGEYARLFALQSRGYADTVADEVVL